MPASEPCPANAKKTGGAEAPRAVLILSGAIAKVLPCRAWCRRQPFAAAMLARLCRHSTITPRRKADILPLARNSFHDARMFEKRGADSSHFLNHAVLPRKMGKEPGGISLARRRRVSRSTDPRSCPSNCGLPARGELREAASSRSARYARPRDGSADADEAAENPQPSNYRAVARQSARRSPGRRQSAAPERFGQTERVEIVALRPLPDEAGP